MPKRNPQQTSLLDAIEAQRRAAAPFKRGDLVGAQDKAGRLIAGIVVYLCREGWCLYHRERNNPPPYYMLCPIFDSAGPAVGYITLRESELVLVRPGRDELLERFCNPTGYSFGYLWRDYAAALLGKVTR